MGGGVGDAAGVVRGDEDDANSVVVSESSELRRVQLPVLFREKIIEARFNATEVALSLVQWETRARDEQIGATPGGQHRGAHLNCLCAAHH